MKRLGLEAFVVAEFDAIAGPSKVPIRRSIRVSYFKAGSTHITRYQGSVLQKPFVRLNSTIVKLSSSPVNPLQLPSIDNFTTSLSSTQPCFGARGDEITVLTSPNQFKATLLEMIKRARRRIIISSLYIGVEEDDIVGEAYNGVEILIDVKIWSMYQGRRAQISLIKLSSFKSRYHPWLSSSDKIVKINARHSINGSFAASSAWAVFRSMRGLAIPLAQIKGDNGENCAREIRWGLGDLAR